MPPSQNSSSVKLLIVRLPSLCLNYFEPPYPYIRLMRMNFNLKVLKMKNLWTLILGLTLAVSTPCYSDCRPDGTHQHGKRVYVCADQSAALILAGSRDDVVIVTSGATVGSTVQGTGDRSTEVRALAINSGRGRDEITNSGTVAATAELSLAANGNPPASGRRSRDDLTGSAAATGIATGSSNCSVDTVVNNGSVQGTSSSSVTRNHIQVDDISRLNGTATFGAPAVIAKGKAIPTRAESYAIGIDAGIPGSDRIANAGTINASATSAAEVKSIELDLADHSKVDASVSSYSSATGVGGAVTVTNMGSIAATAASKSTSDNIQGIIGNSARADVTTTAESAAAGIAGSIGRDSVMSSGAVSAGATATAEGHLNLSQSKADVALNASIQAKAGATGIDGAAGDDTIENSSLLSASAASTARAPTMGSSVYTPGVTDASVSSISDTVGINGGSGRDSLTNSGTISAFSNASAGIGSFQFSAGTALAKATDLKGGATSVATATGLGGGEGDDTVTNSVGGNVDANASATTATANVLVGLSGLGHFATPSAATATSVGLDGGGGSDTIANHGVITSTSQAITSGTGVSVTIVQADIFSDGEARLNATASAYGVKGGAGNDGILNTGSISAAGTASASSLDVGVQAVGTSRTDAQTIAASTAVGVDGGEGADRIENRKTLSAQATASADAVGVEVKLIGIPLDPLKWVGLPMADASTISRANAIGIDGGSGADAITNSGTLSAIGTAGSQSDLISVQLPKPTTGSGTAAGVAAVAAAAAITGSEATGSAAQPAETPDALLSGKTAAVASATGIFGGGGGDTIANTGEITSRALSDAGSISVKVGLGLEASQSRSPIPSTALSNDKTSAQSTAVGIGGGTGDDLIGHSSGSLEVAAGAAASSTSVDAAVKGVFSQEWSIALALGVARGDTEAVASAVGIDGGEGNDTITHVGSTSVAATGSATSTSVVATVSGLEDGLSAGGTYAGTSTTARATAVGLSGGLGGDTLAHTGADALSVAANTTAGSTSVTATVSGAVKGSGIVGGASLIDSTTQASSDATGLAGGAGSDTIAVSGPITVGSTSTATSKSVSVNLGASLGEIGLVGGFSYVAGATTAETTAAGIDGGAGNDRITNTGDLTIASSPGASSTSVGVTAQGVKGTGAALGVAVADASTKATGAATGISGGSGEDTILNLGPITISSLPVATATTVTASVSAAKEGAAAAGTLALTTTSADARATGIDGGENADTILNRGAISATADTQSRSTTVTVSAEGTLTGMAAGVTLSDGTTKALSDAAGIRGGAGDDRVFSLEAVTAVSSAHIGATGVTVNLGGAKTGLSLGLSAADLSVIADSSAAGLDGGSGDDRIVNRGAITATSRSDIASASVSVHAGLAVDGVTAGAALAKGETTATSTAVGLRGGDGADHVINRGTVTAGASSEVSSAGVTVDLEGTKAGLAAGVSALDGHNTVKAVAVGLDGGSGDDLIRNAGATTVAATTTSTRTNVAVTGTFSLYGAAAGASFAEASNTASSAARGIEGGQGNDRVLNEAAITTNATTTATTNSISVGINVAIYGISAGAAVADSDTSATSLAFGLSGGEGDDILRNAAAGDIRGTSSATAKARSVSANVSMSGFSSADLSTTASADYAGISGGSGTDVLVNEGQVALASTSTGDGVSGTGTLTGYSAADVSITARGTATGMDGGAGCDLVKNENSLSASSTATATGRTVSVNLAGAGFAKGETTASAEAVGLNGGTGHDRLVNAGAVTLTATSTSKMNGTAVTLLGYSSSDGGSLAEAAVTGLSGGDGGNTVANRAGGHITGTATATADTANLTINLAGAAVAKGGSAATALATGLTAGNGADAFLNEGRVALTATSTTHVSADLLQILGYGNSNAQTLSTAIATGMAGGDGTNVLLNLEPGSIAATSVATGAANSYKIDMVGTATASTDAAASAFGITGGKDSDFVRNEGAVAAASTATLSSTSRTYDLIAGTANFKGAATSTARGIDAGDGGNVVVNSGRLSVSSIASTTTAGLQASIGISGSGFSNTADAHSIGIITGSGGDWIFSEGALTVTATSSASVQDVTLSGAGLTFGDAAAQAKAEGIVAGDGNDWIVNRGTLTVAPVPDDTHPMSYGYGKTASLAFFELSFSTFGSQATANGIAGGSGNDRIVNQGPLLVGSDHWMASGRAEGLSSAFLSILSLSSTGSRAKAYSTGISGADGHDSILNDTNGLLSTIASSYAYGGSSADAIFGKMQGGAGSTTEAWAVGISGGAGDNSIANLGMIDVLAKTYSEASAVATAGWGKPVASAGSTATANAIGIEVGAGNNTITNTGRLTVTANAEAYAHSWAEEDAGSLAQEDASANATATSQAIGVLTGNGRNRVFNDGAINVTATTKPQVVAETEDNDTERRTPKSNLSAFGIKTGNEDDVIAVGERGSLQVLGQSLSFASGVNAAGIDAGAGSNQLDVQGSVSVTAKEVGVPSLATAGTTGAVGIQAGAGNDTVAIGRGGQVIVESQASPSALIISQATAAATGIDAGTGANRIDVLGRVQLSATQSSTSPLSVTGAAVATGIKSGDGDDRVTIGRDAALVVRSTASPFGGLSASGISTAIGIDIAGGSNRVETEGLVDVTAVTSAASVLGSPSNDARAVGIRTGAGADLIVNAGTIGTAQLGGGVLTLGTAIDSGAGNDEVHLGASSITIGAINLNDGDDLLVLTGQPQVSGLVSGGAGTDTLVFEKTGSIGFVPAGFEQATKRGAGTFTVASLPTMQRIDIPEGVLQVNSSYQFADTGVLQSRVNGDGTFGQFKVNGTVQLDGNLTVVKGTGPFLPGKTYNVIKATRVTQDFKNVVLPEPNLFVTFHKNLLPAAVQIETEVKPFDSQACNRMQHAVATTLDRIAASGHAGDDLMAHMGQLQGMSPSQYHAALSALTPGSYSQNSISTARQYTKSLQHRMQNVRGVTGRNVQKSQTLPEYTGTNSDLFYNFDRFSQVQGKNGLWFDSFEQQHLSGFDEYSMSGLTFGFDRAFSDPLLVGISGGYAKSSAGLDGGEGSGDIGSYYGSLYGSYSLKNLNFDAVFSYGKSRYDTNRLISTGGAAVQADSSHDGGLFSGYLRAGVPFRFDNWVLEPFASAQYVHLNEKGYTESGAGGLGLKVDGTTTRSLVSEVGTRFTRVFFFENGKIVPEISAAWLHDFDITDQTLSSSFAGAPGSAFTVAGPRTAKDGATAGAGITFMNGEAFSMSLNYSGEYRDDISHRVLGEIRINF
jgi:uncharacterized protein YhjY with autotransporter beta-barrel domain